MKQLSERELELVELLAQGKSNAEIARLMFISEYTVKSHIARISGKLDVATRAGIVGAAYQRGLLTVEEAI